jgi:hypothetical protein
MKNTTSDYPNLEQQRPAILRQLSDLRELRRGSITEQFLTVKHADGSQVQHGPYPLLTRKAAQKTVSVRLTDPDLVSLYRQQIQALREFETVVDQLVRVGEQLSDLAVAEVAQKKNSWWNWSKAPRCVVWPKPWRTDRRLILKPGKRSCSRPLVTAEPASWAACSLTGKPRLPGKSSSASAASE